MAAPHTHLASVPLARSPARLIVPPLAAAVAGALAIVAALQASGLPFVLLAAAGGLAVVLAIWFGLVAVTIGLDVEVASLRLHWLGGERRYELVPGQLTRVAIGGASAARLRPRIGAFGWSVGRARLSDGERIEVVRLAATPTMILVPTARGRVGIAPRSEKVLLTALAAAARRQELAEPVAPIAAPVQRAEPLPAPLPPPAEPVAPPPRFLTGIERTLLEERQARERAEALIAAEAERQAAEAAAIAAANAPPPTPRERARAAAGRLASRFRPRPEVWVNRLPWRSPAVVRMALAALVPLLLAIAVFGYAVASGRTADRTDIATLRNLVVGIALAGPVAAVAVVAVQAWRPRLVGLTATSALLALILVLRALVG